MMNNVPPMLCPTCGVGAVSRLEPGTGPHVSKASCAACERFVQWVPRAFIQAPPVRKETQRPGGVNRVVLLGTIGQHGVEVRYANSGAPCASFALIVPEQGQDGKTYPTLIPCAVWGKKGEAAGEIEAG
jgi:hypothetical protein